MGKEIVIKDIQVIKAFRISAIFCDVLLKHFTKTYIKALMNVEDLLLVPCNDSTIELIFINENVKNEFYSQLRAESRILFEKLPKKQVLVEK